MSIWQSVVNDETQGTAKISQDIPKKTYNKIDSICKLQIICAVDNGQCKTDIAREYRIHPQTITYIYKQKESIIKKYTQKYNLLKKVQCMNLDQTLLDWMKNQVKNGEVITENQLRCKALDIINSLSEKFSCIDDWLFDFRIRHNIGKYIIDIECNSQAKDEWLRFLSDLDVKDVYISGLCALSHNLELDSYVNGKYTDDCLSIMFIVNSLGSDKRQLTIVGKDMLGSEANIKSLPVNYYHCDKAQFNYSVLTDYFKIWDNDLNTKGKKVFLIIDLPDQLIRQIQLKNIKIVSALNMAYVKQITEKLIECFKYHYRRLQISRMFTYGKDYSKPSLLEYIHMASVAWYNLSCQYIQRLSFPPEHGSLYFNINNDNDEDHSLLKWCKMCNIPINLELCSKSLDKYIYCDKQLPCFNTDNSIKTLNVTKSMLQNNIQSTSGMEAYQAMKRLSSYLLGENAGVKVTNYAKYLENHVEYGALLQMHQIFTSTNDSI